MRQATATQAQVPNEFVPVSGGSETTSASSMLVAAYMLLWVVLMLFVALSWKRQRATAARLEAIERSLQENSSAS